VISNVIENECRSARSAFHGSRCRRVRRQAGAGQPTDLSRSSAIHRACPKKPLWSGTPMSEPSRVDYQLSTIRAGPIALDCARPKHGASCAISGFGEAVSTLADQLENETKNRQLHTGPGRSRSKTFVDSTTDAPFWYGLAPFHGTVFSWLLKRSGNPIAKGRRRLADVRCAFRQAGTRVGSFGRKSQKHPTKPKKPVNSSFLSS